MKKFLLLFATSLLLVSCHDKNEAYYWNHPEILHQKLQQCNSNASAQGLSCKTLRAIADRMQILAYELQQSPQGFGKKILALQEKIADQEFKLKKEANQKGLQEELEKDKEQLMQRIALVKQFESPEG